MCIVSRTPCLYLLIIVAIVRTSFGQTGSPDSQDLSPSETPHITQMDWDKFDYLYTLEEQPFHTSQYTPLNSPLHSPQDSPPQHSPQKSDQHSLQAQLSQDEETKKLKRERNSAMVRERLKVFKESDPAGHKEWNRKKYLSQKSRRVELKAGYSEEKKAHIKAAHKAYQTAYRQKIKAETGYTKLIDKRYHALQDLVKADKATPEQVEQFIKEKEKRRDSVRLSRLRHKQKQQADTPKPKD